MPPKAHKSRSGARPEACSGKALSDVDIVIGRCDYPERLVAAGLQSLYINRARGDHVYMYGFLLSRHMDTNVGMTKE